MWPAGSRPGSPWSGGSCSAASRAARSPRRSTPSCSGPASRCCAGPTPSPTPTATSSRGLYARYPRLGDGWHALQELYGLYLADDRGGAIAAIVRFCDLYDTGRIPELAEVPAAITEWADEIVASHDPSAGRISNGRLEGTNNKLKCSAASPTASPTAPTSKPEASSPAALCDHHDHRAQHRSPHERAQPL